MTTHTPAAAITRRSLTEAAYVAEATARFGIDPRDWAFECPGCGDVATARDFPANLGYRVGSECVGRHVRGRGCQRTANGALPGPWLLRRDDRTITGVFPFADALSGATTGAQAFDDTRGPARPENPPAPPAAPPRALLLETGTPGRAGLTRLPDGRFQLDWSAWDYRVPLGPDMSVIGFRNGPDLIAYFVHAIGSDQTMTCAMPDGYQEAAAYIDEHRLAVTPEEVYEAFWMIANGPGLAVRAEFGEPAAAPAESEA